MNTEHYFYRNVIFSKQEKIISIVDIDNPNNEREELDPWFAMVFQLADGQHTIAQLLEYMATLYNGNPPPSLEETVHSVVERLAETRMIMLTEKKTDLPYYLSMPYELLDIEKAKKEIEKDRINLN
jgi:hypothetical protein